MTGPTAVDRFGLIIGAMKAGTTTLFDRLATHPEVALSAKKEPKYFARDDVFGLGVDWYHGQWADAPAIATVAMEASTHYSMRHLYPDTVRRMVDHGGPFRFVYVVREPIARIESHYQHALAAGWPVADDTLERGVPAQLVETCRYAWQLEPFADAFGADAVLVLRFDEVMADLGAALARIARHWSIDPAAIAESPPARRNATADKVVSTRVHSLRRVPLVSTVARLFPAGVVEGAKRAVARTGRGTTTLSPAQRREVIGTLAPDLARLQRDWGIGVDDWLV